MDISLSSSRSILIASFTLILLFSLLSFFAKRLFRGCTEQKELCQFHDVERGELDLSDLRSVVTSQGEDKWLGNDRLNHQAFSEHYKIE